MDSLVFPSFSLLISARCGVEDLYINPALIDTPFPAEYLRLPGDTVGVYRSQWQLLSGTTLVQYHFTYPLCVQLSTIHSLSDCNVDVFQNVYIHCFSKVWAELRMGREQTKLLNGKEKSFCCQVTYSVMSLYFFFFVPCINTKHN